MGLGKICSRNPLYFSTNLVGALMVSPLEILLLEVDFCFLAFALGRRRWDIVGSVVAIGLQFSQKVLDSLLTRELPYGGCDLATNMMLK